MHSQESSHRKETDKTADRSPNGASQDQLIADFKVVVADAEALLKATANQGGEKLDEVRAKARESLRVIGERISETEQAMLARTREAARATDLYVHANPWQAAGFAGAAGLLIGLLLRRH